MPFFRSSLKSVDAGMESVDYVVTVPSLAGSGTGTFAPTTVVRK